MSNTLWQILLFTSAVETQNFSRTKKIGTGVYGCAQEKKVISIRI